MKTIALLKNNTTTNRFNRMPAANKLLIAFTACVLTFFSLIVSGLKMEWITRIMISWDIFSLALIIMSTLTFFTMKPRQIRLLVKNQDATRPVVFMIVLISTKYCVNTFPSGTIRKCTMDDHDVFYNLGLRCNWTNPHKQAAENNDCCD